jgi:predicted ATPase
VTFLFTDIAGSTRLWEAAPEAMRLALARHDEILREAINAHEGFVFSTGGDGLAAAFARAGGALAAATAAQVALAAEPWPEGAALRVRMGLHTGEVEERAGDYFGADVNRAARLMATAHGGQVVCSEVTAGLTSGAVTLVDLGEHRLRDLSASQRVFQVGAGVFPPLRSLESFSSNLPAQASAFVGRQAQLVEVAAALRAARVVTLTGVGGVGKTRLAIQAAADLLPQYTDGAWLVELAPAVDPDALVEVVAGALGVPERQGQPLPVTVMDFLRAKHLLVVLDNCEHLLDAVASFVARVVAGCSHVSVLATSREGLGVAGERMFVVPSLGLPEDDSTPEVVGDADSVRLFVERATEAKAGFELTADNAGVVARLVRRLDGIPLAIELAAARVRSQTPAELADRVDERFRLLAGGRRTAVERHQTLRRAIDWSYELLSGDEQLALNRAAVFAADFSLGSAEAVIGGDGVDAFDVVDLLGRLVDKSLVLADDCGGVTRYRLLETIRQYAQERLEAAGEAETVRRRHAEHYAGFAAAAAAGLRGPDEAAWSERVEGELDHLRAALAWSLASGDVDLALRTVAPLALNGTRIGYATGSWFAFAASMPGARTHRLYPEVLAFSGWAEAIAGDLEGAARTCTRAVEAADALGVDERSLCRVLGSVGGVMNFAGNLDEGRRLSQRWIDAARASGDDWELAQALTNASAPFISLGDPMTATALTDEALDIARRLRNPTALCYAAMIAGSVRINTDPASAASLLAEALRTAESVGNQLGIGFTLGLQAWLHAERAEWREAAPFVARCLDHYDRIGDYNGFGVWMPVAALILEALGDDAAAATLLGTTVVAAQLAIGCPEAEQLVSSEHILRQRLGDEVFNRLAALGNTMVHEELVAYVSDKLSRIEYVAG